eukprot:TRINITY_DN15536_c1_g1_i2.p1 TRINITY_DN15536_c1_g1~~TRINITY_DN15536_c1_g1_i2.p1  ORF type:complete len:264 (+),score=53.48 TRINITY_DN15536_c1_g1_i2:65-793(+)
MVPASSGVSTRAAAARGQSRSGQAASPPRPPRASGVLARGHGARVLSLIDRIDDALRPRAAPQPPPPPLLSLSCSPPQPPLPSAPSPGRPTQWDETCAAAPPRSALAAPCSTSQPCGERRSPPRPARPSPRRGAEPAARRSPSPAPVPPPQPLAAPFYALRGSRQASPPLAGLVSRSPPRSAAPWDPVLDSAAADAVRAIYAPQLAQLSAEVTELRLELAAERAKRQAAEAESAKLRAAPRP